MDLSTRDAEGYCSKYWFFRDVSNANSKKKGFLQLPVSIYGSRATKASILYKKVIKVLKNKLVVCANAAHF